MSKFSAIAALRDEAYGEFISEGYTPTEALKQADSIAWREWQARATGRRQGAHPAPAPYVWGARQGRAR
jgi:hypothetical protein